MERFNNILLVIYREIKTPASWFEDLLQEHAPDLPKNQIHFVKGDAGIQIPRLAKEIDTDLIVMGTVSRTGIPGLFIRNIAEKILYSVDRSVLAVKHDGFMSPVEVHT